jgi:hypothetical protein
MQSARLILAAFPQAGIVFLGAFEGWKSDGWRAGRCRRGATGIRLAIMPPDAADGCQRLQDGLAGSESA